MEEKKLYNAVRKIITLADGRQIEIETGKLAKQADGSVVVKMGDTMSWVPWWPPRTQNPTPISCPSRWSTKRSTPPADATPEAS